MTRKRIAKTYFTGLPCVHGHTAERYVKTAHCVECERLRTAKNKAEYKQRCAEGMLAGKFDPRLLWKVGNCDICKDMPGWRRLAHDHCHITGKLRGFLCSKCNMALGLFRDKTDLLEAATLYLKKYE